MEDPPSETFCEVVLVPGRAARVAQEALGVRVLPLEKGFHHGEDGLALGGSDLRSEHGGEMDRLRVHSRRGSDREGPQVGGQMAHVLVAQGVARHQRGELPAGGVEALPHGAGEARSGIGGPRPGIADPGPIGFDCTSWYSSRKRSGRSGRVLEQERPGDRGNEGAALAHSRSRCGDGRRRRPPDRPACPDRIGELAELGDQVVRLRPPR